MPARCFLIFLLIVFLPGWLPAQSEAGLVPDSLYENIRSATLAEERLLALCDLGEWYYERRLNDSAYAVALRTLETARGAERTDYHFYALRQLGNLQGSIGNYEEAISYLEQARNLALTTDNDTLQLTALVSLAAVIPLHGAENISRFGEALSRAETLVAQNPDLLPGGEVDYYFQLGRRARSQEDFATALNYYRKTYEFAENTVRRAYMSEEIAKCLQALERPREAAAAYEESLELMRSSTRKDTSMLHYFLADVYLELGDAEAVFDHLSNYSAGLHASATGKRQRAIMAQDAAYQDQLRQQEIKRLEEMGRYQRMFGFGAVLVALLLGALVWFLLRQRQRIIRQNALIGESLTEKNILLKEIHHRVKNNLQMISTLLGLQSELSEDTAVHDALEMGRGRVRSMALLHHRLYLRDEVSPRVNAREYLDQLLRELLGSLNVRGVAIQLKTELAELEMDVDRLVPLGLIANELITNALKYAYQGRESGELSVGLHRREEAVFFHVADDGQGYPARGNPWRGEGFGGLLVRSLAEQLYGELDHQSTPAGTKVTLRFPLAGRGEDY